MGHSSPFIFLHQVYGVGMGEFFPKGTPYWNNKKYKGNNKGIADMFFWQGIFIIRLQHFSLADSTFP